VSWWSQISETFLQGLQITVIGMLLVFFTLGLIIVALILLTRLPGLRAETGDVEQKQTAPMQEYVTIPGDLPVPENTELAQVAAIALALVRSKQRPHRRTGKPARGAWRSYGRAHQLGL